MQDFRNLEVWAMAHSLTLAIYRVTKAFLTEEKFGLISQLRRCSASIAANLAEGCGRGSDADFARHVQIAMGSASEVEYHLLLAKDLEFLSNESHHTLREDIVRIKRMLSALLKTLNSRVQRSPK